jgi:prepilin signal peptidase PulO-like enzyme (type II secretory pathway)
VGKRARSPEGKQIRSVMGCADRRLADAAGGWLKAKVNMEERLVARELAYRLGLIALGQVHLDEAGSGALPELVI